MRFQQLLLPQEPIAQGVVAFIVILIVVGLVLLCRAGRRLRTDRNDLETLQSEGAYKLARSWTAMQGETVFAARAKVINSVAATVPVSEQSSLIVGILADPALMQDLSLQERASLEGRVHWPQFISNACVFVGLLGTVIGLGLVIGTIDPQSTKLKVELSKALSDMGTAFSCTFYGVVGSLVVGWAVHWYLGRASAFCEERDLWLAQIAADAASGRRVTEAQPLPEALKDAANHLRNALQPFVTTLNTGAEQIRAASEICRAATAGAHAATVSATASQKEMTALVVSIQAKQQESNAEFLRLAGPLTAAAETTAALNTSLTGISGDLQSVITQLKGSLDGFAGQFAAEKRLATEEHTCLLQELRTVQASLNDTVTLVRQLVSNETWVASVNAVAERLDATSTQLGTLHQDVARQTAQVPESIRHLASRFDLFSASVRDDLGGYLREVGEVNKGLRSTLSGLSGLIDDVEGALQDVPVVRAEVKGLTQPLGSALEEVGAAAQALRKAAGDLQAAANQTRAAAVQRSTGRQADAAGFAPLEPMPTERTPPRPTPPQVSVPAERPMGQSSTAADRGGGAYSPPARGLFANPSAAGKAVAPSRKDAEPSRRWRFPWPRAPWSRK